YMHGADPAIKRWLQERMEAAQNTPTLSREQKLRILARLTDAETLETFLHRKYIGKKRFSLEGAESLIPLLDWLVEEFGRQGGEEIVTGMAHRGRLNVLVNVLGKGFNELFAEFEDTEVETMMGRGDVKYHMGYSSDPEDARSTPYATDIARVLRAPVFHVNGEDPEAVVWAVQLAVDYRQQFQQDVLIDLYSYRKYGHNEGDEPAFTQPRMYEV